MSSFFDVINQAIADLKRHGYDSAERVDGWITRITESALRHRVPESVLQRDMKDSLMAIYRREVERGGVLKRHKGVKAITLDYIKPTLRGELDRRIMANANLIKFNRKQSIAKTLQRFSGWATSIPAGGSKAVDNQDVEKDLKKALKSLPYEERRVIVDQGHKFTAAINNILAKDGGAIAVIWHSRWRQAGYDYRQDHKERDKKMYLMRDSWARKQGLVKAGTNGYYDQITAVGEEVFCRCTAEYLYDLEDVEPGLLTDAGRDYQKKGKAN